MDPAGVASRSKISVDAPCSAAARAAVNPQAPAPIIKTSPNIQTRPGEQKEPEANWYQTYSNHSGLTKGLILVQAYIGNAINGYGHEGIATSQYASELRLRAPTHCENNPRRIASAAAHSGVIREACLHCYWHFC